MTSKRDDERQPNTWTDGGQAKSSDAASGMDKVNEKELPDRIKATLTIDIDFAKEDQPLIGEVLQNIIDNIGFSSSGNGSRTAQSHYSYNLESNLPKKAMTFDHLLDLMDQALEPGEPSAREQIADTMHPDYEQAQNWWDGLTDAQKNWLIQRHPDIRLVTKAWEVHKEMDFADKVFFKTLS